MNRKLLILVTFFLIAVFVVGCGGSGADTGDNAATAGEELFNQTVIGANAGCVTCHSLEPDTVVVGPSMAAFSLEAAKQGEDLGMTAEEFIRQSIVDPNAVIPEGFPADTMPLNWEEALTADQIDNLVAFLMSLK